MVGKTIKRPTKVAEINNIVDHIALSRRGKMTWYASWNIYGKA